MSCVAVKWQTWKEIDLRGGKNICWCRKVCFVFSQVPGEKVWNLIKPFSGGAALIRDSLNKQRVPHENKDLYAPTQAIFTSWLLFLLKESCCIGNRWTISFSAWGIIFPLRDVSETYSLKSIYALNKTSKGAVNLLYTVHFSSSQTNYWKSAFVKKKGEILKW